MKTPTKSASIDIYKQTKLCVSKCYLNHYQLIVSENKVKT